MAWIPPRLVLEEHATYLGDAVRLETFARALRAVIRPGDVVVDLGCGTGVLGMLACRAGARTVYAIDDGGIIEAAREISQVNGLANAITHFRGPSASVSPPESADAIVCDLMGPLGFEGGIVEAYSDAAHRLLRPGGCLIPSSVTTWLAPAEAPAVRFAIDRWDEPTAGFSFAPLRRKATNLVHLASTASFRLLGDAAAVVDFRLGTEVPAGAQGHVQWTISAPGTMHALAGWFTATLAPGIMLTNDPSSPNRIQRAVAMLPLASPVELRTGDVVSATMQIHAPKRVVAWQVAIDRNGQRIGAFAHNTLQGRFLSTEDLAAVETPGV